MPAYSGEEAQVVVSHTPFMDGSFPAQGFTHDGASPSIATSSEASQLLLPSTSTYATEIFGLTSPTNGQLGSDYEMTHDSLWSNLPSGFELEDWDTFIFGFGQIQPDVHPNGHSNGTVRPV
ncbi:hypothetical protein HETIRDRAFT_455249 [Heterobasidion irregulare TC 32-1]|uniref:Uncharacterized protein n=1 Tax=Heterobasidion irregulare (strain TC 32-1) TaxID=747525 RepID=W4JTE9_HETIT|nr:uncharacterized protein HETIRDRAFT_455249 [Heterobasidion irregulare TC 32-1]ETW76793.1 hypothetical protein HETIRDRAFT_455249 [Heterobasidion irregulare TC 32-1]